LNYSGYNCPVCGKEFGENEDIVVCPVCGAPHHRECYKKIGGCALEANHAKGISWEDYTRGQAAGRQQPPRSSAGPGPAAGEMRRCPSCGSINPPDGVFCQVCGTMLGRPAGSGPAGQAAAGQGGQRQSPPGYYPGQTAYMPPYAGMNPDDRLGEATVKEVATYVGPSSAFYLSRFRLSVNSNNRNMSFCWSAFLFSFLYFFYRKVNRVAVPLLVIFLITMVPTFVYSYEYMRELVAQYTTVTFPLPVISTPTLDKLAIIANVFRLVQFGVAAAMGFTGHKLYLRDINRKIAAVKTRVPAASTEEYIRALSRQGGVSTVSVAIIGGALAIAYFALSYFMTISMHVPLA